VKTKTAKKKPAQERLTDEELATLIKGFLAKLPDAGQSAFVKNMRSAGKSVSGGRVRALWGKAARPAKAAAARKSRPKAAAAA